MNGVNTAGAMAAAMSNGTNGTQRNIPDQGEMDFKTKLNTYIYDYFLKNEQYELARMLHNSTMPVNTAAKGGGSRRPNGLDENSMDTDSKDDIDTKKPHDLPRPGEVTALTSENSFLLDWFTLFWEIFWAPRQPGRVKVSQAALSFMDHTRQQNRIAQENRQQFLRQPGLQSGQGQLAAANMLRMQQAGMGMTHNDMRQRANQNNMRLNPQQQQQLVANRLQMPPQQQQMERGGSDVDMNGRPRTPSSGENAPSPSKRPRLEGAQYQGQPMMPGGRFPPGIPGQNMIGGDVEASPMLSFQNNPGMRTPMDLYSQKMQVSHRQNMPQTGMMPHGGPMMPQGGEDFYANGMRAPGLPNGNQSGGNHALQDYQMQLMLLEQQNKKRLLMARQEQDSVSRIDGSQGIPGQAGGYAAPNMSPSGSRSGPSPNPNDQMKRETPKMGQVAIPGSPMPDGSMPHGRGSPGAMNFNNNNMPMDMMAMKNDMQMNRGPSSHPQFNGVTNPGLEAIRAGQPANGRMPNGTNWQQGPHGQAPAAIQAPQVQQPQQGQQQGQQQMGTPQQRNSAMPPPQNVPAANVAGNGRPASPAQQAASSTPQQSNKPMPAKKKNEKGESRKRATQKKGTGTAATPAADAENPPPTPNPPPPITPMHQKMNESKTNQGQAANSQAPVSAPAPAPAASAPQPQPEVDLMQSFAIEGMDQTVILPNMAFANADTGDVFDQLDFDSFLREGADHDYEDLANYSNFNDPEADPLNA